MEEAKMKIHDISRGDFLVNKKKKKRWFAKGGQKVGSACKERSWKWVKRQAMSSLEKTCPSSQQKAGWVHATY